MPEPPPITGISELVLEVSDLEGARRFYRDLLGFEETLYGEGAEGRYWYLIGDTARLGLWTSRWVSPAGAAAPTSTSPFTSTMRRSTGCRSALGGTGAEVEGPVQLGPGRAIYVTDPDGNVVEFWSQDMADYAAAARAGGPPGTLRAS